MASLLAAVEAVVSGSRLTLSDMGRGLAGSVAVKHNIKRIDRLLGNSALLSEVPKLYNYVRKHPVSYHLVLIKHPHQKRHLKSRLGKRVHSSRSLKNAHAQREPWSVFATLRGDLRG